MKSCPCKDHALWFGLVAFVIGAVILLQKFDLIPSATFSYLWPCILVVSGLKMMLCCGCPCTDCKGECKGDSCDCKSDPSMPCDCKKEVVAKKKLGKKKGLIATL
ncbi:MAG: DUF5668 domain-containing protein [Candidatus Gracilibacteria bacterium]